METKLGLRPYYTAQEMVFRIKTATGPVYMRTARTNFLNEERAVVEVDTHRFIELWKREPYSSPRSEAHGTPVSWKADRKFADAVKGFGHGDSNPVPLANISCLMANEKVPVIEKRWGLFKKSVGYAEHTFPYVAFTDGITRTIWLAAHGAPCFPVECHVRDAELLQKEAGTEGSKWMTVDNLIPVSA
ncbi:plasmid fertility inhibition factor family protein [Paraburkholderia tagetis]|uniref:Uncharacterized protein n=1 Tax=Paraburkholderia tagetis TaxID=2913261 RepID=A0A9X1UH84_9BURK|nr:hypothetical protein [Paraburkholderia tagetis]MCG5076359.1 hypothetical protein [Paraburkholderia tagetis]